MRRKTNEKKEKTRNEKCVQQKGNAMVKSVVRNYNFGKCNLHEYEK